MTEPAKTFTRKFWGYEPSAVDSYIETATTRQQLLRNDIESLRARLQESGDELAALRNEVAVLVETSPSPHAVQQRMAKMLRGAVEEISQMQAEARAEADALIAAAAEEAEAERRKHEEMVADMVARRSAMEAEFAETKRNLDAELHEAWQNASAEREQLLADAKQQADYEREQARRAVNDAREHRIRILEQLMGVYRDLGGIPATLESAYQDRNNSAEAVAAGSVDERVSTG